MRRIFLHKASYPLEIYKRASDVFRSQYLLHFWLARWIKHIKEAAESFKKRKDKAQEPAQADVLAVEPPQIIRR